MMPLPTVDRQGPVIPGDTCCGFVAVARRFPLQPTAHQYNRVYPSTVEFDPNSREVKHVSTTTMIRNDPALARNGIANLVTIQPKCMSPVDKGAYYEIMKNFANSRGAVACPACYPESYGTQNLDDLVQDDLPECYELYDDTSEDPEY